VVWHPHDTGCNAQLIQQGCDRFALRGVPARHLWARKTGLATQRPLICSLALGLLRGWQLHALNQAAWLGPRVPADARCDSGVRYSPVNGKQPTIRERMELLRHARHHAVEVALVSCRRTIVARTEAIRSSSRGPFSQPTCKNDLTLAITIAHPLLARSAPMREAHGLAGAKRPYARTKRMAWREAPLSMREAHGHPHTLTAHTGTSKLARSAPSHMLPSVAVCLFTAFT
jgi:hypothetical protein